MKEIPIWEKANFTLEEAVACSGIGTGKLREITTTETAILCFGWAASD